jgi:two-component system alkaline phosphatase synthesis response regulator PhoP
MSERKQRILLVEDDESIQMGVRENLEFSGYEVVSAADGREGLNLAMTRKPDLVLLDIMLPGISGYEVCRELRDRGFSMPVIMLTARQEEFDKLHGFEMGADDYVTKPFSVQELLARVRAVLQRSRTTSQTPERFSFGDCVLDMNSRVLRRKGRDIPLTRTECDLLAYLCRNEGKALSREQVMNDVWGVEYYGTQRSLDSFVAALRSKIEKKAAKPEHILTVHGVGYKFVK